MVLIVVIVVRLTLSWRLYHLAAGSSKTWPAMGIMTSPRKSFLPNMSECQTEIHMVLLSTSPRGITNWNTETVMAWLLLTLPTNCSNDKRKWNNSLPTCYRTTQSKLHYVSPLLYKTTPKWDVAFTWNFHFTLIKKYPGIFILKYFTQNYLETHNWKYLPSRFLQTEDWECASSPWSFSFLPCFCQATGRLLRIWNKI